ncbi:serine/threonine protein kinase [Actinacidiphila paucisporea]|uniref:Serine/threonine protein kinase n=1 Tax=Actinacidiphila paucisporea TaxID=310782 RepID=A0A1M7PY86_9ACTN|nr:serine/threonine protein kinase [Actinacidiphila paucisporea]
MPTLDGDSAVYADVLPGVDLRMTASVEGYREVLVVKTPAAAADPKVRRIRFGMSADGLSVRSTAGGGLSAVAPDGQDVFTSPPALVWDSTGEAGEQGPSATGQASRAGAARAETTVPGADPAAEAADGASGPAPGANVAAAPAAVDSDSLTLVPDADLLSTTDTAAFPLFIDPDVSLSSGVAEHTLLRSDGYASYNWGNGSDGRGEGDGHCGTWNGYYCGPGYTQRLYFQFAPGALKGKTVLGATFRVTSPWAFQCDARWTDLERTDNIYSSTIWDSRPREMDMMVDRDFSAGRGSSCDPDSPAAPIEFSDNSAETNENLTPTVASFAAGKFAKLTLELRAHDESDTSAWKRFKNDAVLSVTFVGQPALPTDVGIVSGSSPVCHTNYLEPQTVSDPTPLIAGRPQTAAGGESGARLRVRWRVEKWNGTVWGPAIADLLRPTSGFVGDNVQQTVSAPALSEGVSYRLRAQTLSYEDNQASFVQTAFSGWSCYFTVDPTAPKAPTVAFVSTYTECLANSCIPGGGPGVQGTVKFTAATGDTDKAFEYKLSSSDTWHVLATGATSTPITPQIPGTYHLEVRGEDSLGRWGAETVKDFVVAAGQGPAGQWHFDEASGAALDSSSTVAAEQDNAAVSATGAARDGFGRRGDIPTAGSSGGTTADRGLHLDGAAGFAETPKPVIDVRASYTVSAWVRLDTSTVRTMAIASQDDSSVSPFYLAYAADGVNDWSMRIYSCPTSTTCTWSKARSTVKPVPGAWTYVTGRYDAQAKTLSLYVNGILQASVPAVAAAAYNKPLQFGRDSWSGSQVDYFDGSIDEAKVWQRALTDQEIATEARMLDDQGNSQVELVASWQPDGQTGTTVVDTTSGYGRPLSLSGGASLTGDGLLLDGTNAAATSAGRVVDEAGSFTVTSSVALDGAVLASKPDGYSAQIVGQRSADGSSWGLWYELVAHDGTAPIGLWHFGRLNTDGTFTGAVSEDVATLDTPVQVTGVFDAQSAVVRLYVGAVQTGGDPVFARVAGTGDLAVGEAPSGTGWGHYLPGTVSDVRIWAGAMAGEEQISATVGG